MTIPYMMNCSHSPDGWCLNCVQKLAEDKEMAEACLNEIYQTLKKLSCCCGPQAHENTPPMFYPEWIHCVVRKSKEPNHL